MRFLLVLILITALAAIPLAASFMPGKYLLWLIVAVVTTLLTLAFLRMGEVYER